MMSPQQVLDMENQLNGTNLTLSDYLIAGQKSGWEIQPEDVDMAKYNFNAKNRTDFYQITKTNKAGTNWFRN